MVYDVTLNEDRGSFLISRNDKSSWSKPVGYQADLDKCGSPTHVKYGNSLGLNFRYRCSSPKPMLQASVSTISALVPFDGVQALPTGFAADWGVVEMGLWLLNNAFSVALIAPPAIDGETLVRRGGSYIFDDLANGGSRIEVGVPQKYTTFDNCGREIGTKVSASYSYQGYNLTTCKSLLVHQASLGFFIKRPNPLVAANDPFGFETAADVQAVLADGFYQALGLVTQANMALPTLSADLVTAFEAAFPIPYVINTNLTVPAAV